MKIAVVGTSNSILANGYFSIYQAIEYPNQVDNFSLGGANCQLIPYSIEKYKLFENYDFLITDCAVNDGDYVSLDVYSPDWLYNELYTIMSMIKESPIKHLHLIFPSDIKYKEHYKIHCQVCQELAVPYVDIEKILSESSKLGQKELFHNQKHIAYFLAKQVAYLIKTERKHISSAPKSKDLSACYQQKKYTFYSLPDKFKYIFPICTKSSSLLTNQYVLLKDTDTLHLDNLPPLNLESISFWSNTKGGYYTLETENHKQNFNLYRPEAHYTHFRPIAREPFPVNKFLTLKPGLDPNSPDPLPIFTLTPPVQSKNELFLNSFLFSEDIKEPLTWQPKNLSETTFPYLTKFVKIYSFCTAVPNFTLKNLTYIADEFIFIAATLYPENSLLRKRYLKLLKKTNNPYFVRCYVKLYLLPRKKYTMAMKLLTALIKQKEIKQAIFDLVHCHIQLKQFDKALSIINNTLSDPKSLITKQHLLCSLYAHMDLRDLFLAEAKKLLALNEHVSTILTIIDHCIMLKQYQTAFQCIEMIYEEQRNFFDKSKKEQIVKKADTVQACIDNELKQ